MTGSFIGSEMTVEDLVRDYPSAVGALRELGIVCIQCGEPAWGTLGELIAAKERDVDEVLAALRSRVGG